MATITAAPRVTPGRGGDVGPRRIRHADRGPAPVRLTGRGRVALALMLVVVAAVAVTLLGLGAATAGRASGGPATTTVVVQPGESLWQIAGRVAPGGDRRVTVDRLQKLNDLGSSVVVPGQVLVVPVAAR